MNILIGIVATVIIGLVSFVFGRWEKRLDKIEDKSDGIVTNYLSRFDEIKTLLSEMKFETHQQINLLTVENQSAHADLTEMFNFVKAKINQQQIIIDQQKEI